VPQLHIVVEFVLPKAFPILSHPDLRQPVGRVNIDGVAKTQYLAKHDSTKGHARGSPWLNSDRSPMTRMTSL